MSPLYKVVKKPLVVSSLTATFLMLLSSTAMAADKLPGSEFDMKGWAYLGAALAIGIGVAGGAVGQGRAAAAALEGIARNPGAAARIQTPMILGLALIESLVLLAFVIAFFLQGK